MKIDTVQFLIDKMDEEQEKHANGTAMLCYAMGQAIGCNPKELELLWFAGLLLNCGKLEIDDAVKKEINKETGSNKIPEDKRYIIYSQALLQSIGEGFEEVATVLSQVEENVDGTGEPLHLLGKDIDTLSKVVKISSFYDDLMLQKKTHEETCKTIRLQSDKMFPKRIITPFIKCVLNNKLNLEYKGREACEDLY